MYSLNVLNAEHFIQSGFNNSIYFAPKQTILFSDSTFLRYIQPNQHPAKVKSVRVGGTILSMQISADYFYAVVCVEQNASSDSSNNAIIATNLIVVFDTETFSPIAHYAIALRPNHIRIAATNEMLWAFQHDDAQNCSAIAAAAVIIKCFTLIEGKAIASGEIGAQDIFNRSIITKAARNTIEVSLCPADDSIACLMCNQQALLLRISGTNIECFSKIQFNGMQCHDWSNDVTLAFGTNECQIRLYRETQPSTIIDLRKISNQLLTDSESAVTLMSSTAEKFVCVVDGLIAFVFDIQNGECQWHTANAIVVSTIGPSSAIETFLLDASGDNYLYSDGIAIWLGSLRYSDAICGRGASVVFMKHRNAIQCIQISQQCDRIVSLDKSGLIIISTIRTQMLVSYAILDEAISVVLFAHGHCLLVVFPTRITLFHVLYHSLQRSNHIINNRHIEKIAVDDALKRMAIYVDECLLFYDFNTLEMTAQLPIPFRQHIRTLKWSASGDELALLTVDDTIALINVNNCSIQWHIELKMRSFVDIALEHNAIYALNKKFLITKFFNAKEIEQISGHSGKIAFGSTSTSVLKASQGHIIGSSSGHILHVPFDLLDDITILHTHIPYSITKICSTIDHSLLYVGFEDGHVAYFRFHDDSIIKKSELHEKNGIENGDEDCDDNNDDELILYQLAEISNLKTLVKELDVERNFLRNETEKLLIEYKQSKDNQLHKMQLQFDENAKLLNEKVNKIEEKVENVQVINALTTSNLRKLYEDESIQQEEYYQKMLNEQMKQSIEKERLLNKRLDDSNQRFNIERNQLIKSFHFTEQNLKATIQQQQNNIFQLKESIKRLKDLQNELMIKYEKEIEKIKNEQKFVNESHRKEIIELENEILQFKTNCIILTEQRDEANNSINQIQIQCESYQEHIEQLLKQITQKQQTSEMEQNQVKRFDEQNALSREKIAHLKHDLKLAEKEARNEKTKHKIAQHKLKELYAKIEELSKNVYNSRELEHNALALIALINKQ